MGLRVAIDRDVRICFYVSVESGKQSVAFVFAGK